MRILLITLLLALPIAACTPKGPAERAGERLDDAADEIGDAARDVRDAAEDAADDVQDAVDDARE